MSFQDKPGKTSSSRRMIIRQQLSDLLSFGKIKTTLTKAKETKRHAERVITLAKKGNIASIQRINSIILRTKIDSQEKLSKKIIELGKKYKDRKGGYTRILKLDNRKGDQTQEALLELV